MSLSQSFSQKIGNVRPLNPCPSLDVDFANGGYVTDLGFADQASVGSANFNIGAFNGPDPIFTRSSAATFRGSNGLIQYAPENLLLRSEELDSGSWLLQNTQPIIPNAAIAPNGTLTADKAIWSNGSSDSRVYQNTSFAAGTIYTMSAFVKPAGFNKVILSAQAALFSAIFDLQSISFTGAGTGYISSTINNVGDGWFRVSVTGIAQAGGYFHIGNLNTGDVGNGTSGIYIWGAQLERSSTVRPYISTTTTARYGPRFEYDLSGNPLGLLMEEQSQNLLSYSEQFNDGAWFKNNLNTTGTPAWLNVAAAPNGTQTADLIIANGATTQHSIYTSVQASIGITYTWSVYAKANSLTQIKMTFGPGGNTNGAFFNLNNGTKGTVNSGYSSKITALSDGWYRCSITYTSAITGTSYPIVYLANGSESLTVTNGSIYIWGAQLEAKPFATSYMPTFGGPMTRNADTVNSTIGSWFNQSEGTIVVSGDRGHSPSLNASLYDSFYEFSDGGGGYHSAHFSDGTSEEFFGDNGAYATSAAGIATIGTFTSIASSYSSNDIYTTRDGVAPNSAASATFVTTPTTLNIGYSQALTQAWNGHIKSFRYFPKALPNNLQRLSS